ncbi:phage tail protein [Kosakonia oryziphila]|uniref:Phage tail-collar fibre protein n=1 Tax=Kosakonia oryziphila TaxID=1005667 RepID=A0A1C4G0V6_9ENTR|nr:phage tail protein [Kosakonia oryziphila]SCC61828.1 Phage tail-collar fibre protein [Kosakonia oryziphila]
MTAKYFAILTNQGAARLANAAALGTTLNITQMAVGDANGVLPTPDPAQTALINQKRIAALNMLSIDPNNSSQIIAEQVIPENEGGYWIREIGLYDDSGVLVAVANCPETYKPLLQEGSGRTQTIRMVLIVSSTSAVTLKIDPAVVLATRQYVDNKVIEVKAYADNLLSQHIAASNPHTQYAPIASPTFTGTPVAPTQVKADNSTKLATTAHVKSVVADYAPLASPAMTGVPTAPTAAQSVNNTQLATTAFVKAAIAALVASSPATLDTLNELAAALGNDPNFATTMTNALAGKQPLDNTLTALSGKSVAALLEYLGLSDIATAGVAMGSLGGQSSNGYWKFPGVINGVRQTLIVQWYTASATQAGAITVNFPIPFPNAFLADANMAGGSGTALVNGGTVSKTSRQLYCNVAMSVAVITVGY